MGFFSNIVSAIKNSNIGPGIFSGSSVPNTTNTASTNKGNVSATSSKGAVRTNTNKGNASTASSTNRSNNRTSLASTLNRVINNNRPSGNSQAYYVTHNEQGRPHGTILSEEAFKNDPISRYYRGDYNTYKAVELQKIGTMSNAVSKANEQRRAAGLSGNWTADDVRMHGMVLNNMAMGGQKITSEDQLGVSDNYKKAASEFMASSKPNEFTVGTWGKWLEEIPDALVQDSSAYKAAQERALNSYMSGEYFGPTWEAAKERNPLLTDEALIENYKDKVQDTLDLEHPGNPAPGIYSDSELIKTLEQKANKAYALKRKQSPDYIAKDYDEYVDMVNQGLIAPRTRLDATGKQISIPYGTSKEDYNAYLQRKYADNGDDYYNRSYEELAKDDPKFWAGDPEASDANGNMIDPNTYLWLLNNPLTRTVLQGMDASGNFSGAGPTLEQLVRDPAAGGYGLYSEKDIADMYASHILADDEMGAMLESNPELLNAILTQAYTPTVDPNNPTIYEGYENSITGDKKVSGTSNLAKDYKTPAQLAAELLADPTSAEGMPNLQLLAAANTLNNQDVPASEETGNKNKPSSSSGSGGSGGGSYGGGSMPAGGNPETTDTLYSMPEVGNYAARMILNKMLPTGYGYDYNKRLDKRLADIAAAEQNYKGNVLPSVERTYQDQAANTMANLVAALRANRASGLTSGASRGAQAASDVQAVQAASKENSENLRKLVNDNLASFLTQLASKRATAGNDTASELQGYASPMMTALGEVLAQYNYGSAAAQVNNGGLRRMQSYLV